MSFASSQIERRIPNLLRHCTFEQLKQIHGFLLSSSLARHPALPSLCIRRAAELGETEHAELIFFSGDPPHILHWNALIRGCFQSGHYKKALNLFDWMSQRGQTPNEFTYSDVFASCGALEEYGMGKKAHCRSMKDGFDLIPLVAISLFNLYAESSSLADAKKIFDGFLMKSVGLWNKMMSFYVRIGDILSARKLFDEMAVKDTVSWNTMLSGCVRVKQVERAKNLFQKMPERNVFSYTVMVGALADAGDLIGARRLFDEIPEGNVASWNCMLSAYTQSGRFKQALDLFLQMQSIVIQPDGFTFVSALSACAHLGDLKTGKWIHLHLIQNWLTFGAIVGTALMEMYAKCGDIDSAFRVFIKTSKKDVFCWNVMIKSLATHGRANAALQLFASMRNEKLQLNDFTLMGVLFACSHGGLVEDGRRIFESMERELKMKPRMEHYGCLIDLLCRAGRVEEAYEMVKQMPHKPDVLVWGALLGGCREGNETALAEKVMKRIDEVDGNGSGAYAKYVCGFESVG
ncbi:pentatricopeptide repeat-containing protein At3g29230-like [Phalaenopsis equestris]|uniref:pentatricopeptide repeat-containing protein At3g29230-like n=1 Tax=Phalaenopsis equestris TaxID=78828 RepID=UPI0009E36C37|nr:pentatricopeptide repeat-containing protein At3g29230-like [Phalaenopsis equestris]